MENTGIMGDHKTDHTEQPILDNSAECQSQPIEFTIVRDTHNKITRIMEGKIEGDILKTFDHESGIRYHYTNNIGQFDPESLGQMQVFNKSLLSSLEEGNNPEIMTTAGEMPKILDICAKNKKELLHTEDVVLSDFTIGDRMEAHVLPKAHINCHSLLTCELNGQLCVVYILEGTHENPVVGPFTTGGHLAVTDEVRGVIESRDQYSHEEFQENIFSIIRKNMIKEIQEETSITLSPENITYFQADKNNPKKTHVRFGENFSKVTKGNEEDIHIFHAHLTKEQIENIVADKNDGVEGHVVTPIDGIERILTPGYKIPLYKLNGQPFHFHKREEFSSDEEYESASHLIDRDDFNQEFIKIEPNYIPTFVRLVKENLGR